MQDLFEKCYYIFSELAKEKKWEKCNQEPAEAWVVLINGERIVLSSGKYLWTQRRFAKSALINELSYIKPPYNQTGDIGWYTFNKRVAKTWMEKHTEVITLSEWRKEENHNRAT